MARFDVYRLKHAHRLVIDCQSDWLEALRTRFVVPLLPIDEAPKPAARLNPVYAVEGVEMAMLTQYASAVAVDELGDRVASLTNEADAVMAALDMLICGF